VDVIGTVSASTTGKTGVATGRGLGSIDADGFMQVLIKQLQYQDPFKPMDNAEMVSQISQIRNMEMNYTLTQTLERLKNEQRFGAASSMIGRHVIGTVTSADGQEYTIQGTVASVRFTTDGEPILELDTGASLPLKNLTNVTDPSLLVGKYVTGLVASANGTPQEVKGIVIAVRYDESGRPILELQNGARLPLENLVSATDPALIPDSQEEDDDA